MSVLSARSIRRLCNPAWREAAIGPEAVDAAAGSRFAYAVTTSSEPMITPFTERGVVNGKSYGLSACTYDCRIDQDLVLEPMWRAWTAPGDGAAKYRVLASTMERFCIPHNVCGSVLDKSSFARVFVSAFNTHLDPGWDGFLTVELVNFGPEVVTYEKGDPVCQIKFEWLDEPTDLPYVGRKYSDQPARPVPAINE